MKTRIRPVQVEREYEEVEPRQFCCDRMEKRSRFFQIDRYSGDLIAYLDDLDSEREDDWTGVVIHFCPFCGAKIDIEKVEGGT